MRPLRGRAAGNISAYSIRVFADIYYFIIPWRQRGRMARYHSQRLWYR